MAANARSDALKMVFGQLLSDAIDEGGAKPFVFYDPVYILAIKTALCSIIIDIVGNRFKDWFLIFFVQIGKAGIYFSCDSILPWSNGKTFSHHHIEPAYMVNQ